MVFVVAVGAFPLVVFIDDDLAVIAADVAVVAFGVEFGVLDVIVDEFDDLFHRLQIVLHIGDLDVGDAPARRDGLELRLEREFGEGVDILAHVYMIRIGVIALVGDVFDGAEALFIDAGETVAQRFRRRAVQGEAEAAFALPFVRLFAHMAHDAHGELFPFRVRLRHAHHQLGHLVQADVAQRQGGIAAEQQRVDDLALIEAGDGAVLPVDGRHVRLGAQQGAVAAHERLAAQFQPLVEQLPELFFVAARHDADLRQVDGDDALIEAAFKFIIAVFVFPGG